MKLAVTNLILSRRPVKLPNTILKSALGLNSLWPNHTIKHLRSWSMQIQAMASCMTAPSHYLKQCRLIIKLINNVPWHLSQWIIIKYLKMPNSKMRLKLVCWDKFTPRPEIIHLFSSDNSFLHHGGKLIYLLSPSLIPLASVHSRGTRYPPYVSFVTTPQGGNVPKTPVAWWVKSQGRLWPPLLKLKFGNGWSTSNCCSSSCKKFNSGFQFQFQFQFQGFQFQFHFQFHQFQFQFQFRNWNWNWAAIPIPELNWPQPCQ